MLTPIDRMPRTTPTKMSNQKTIKFSHDYPKLHGQRSAYLLAVEPLTIDINTSDELLEYDTATGDGGHYKLEHGEYIQLIFIGCEHRIPFCTIRKRESWFNGQKNDKFAYYRKLIGQIFNIEITKKD